MKRQSSTVLFGSTSKKIKTTKEQKNKKNNDSEDEGDEGDFPFKLPSIFKQEEDEYVYLNNNHLFYHTDVSEKSVDQVKKHMREYLMKINKVKHNHMCGVFTPKPLFLHIYSPGGDVYASLSLYDFIKEYSNTIPVYTVVEGFAASAATIISVAGTRRFITPNSYMLIHQLSTFIGGNFEQIKDEFGNCEKLMSRIKKIYSERTTIPKKQLTDILKHDITWDADECKKNGLVDEIKLIDLFNDKL
jgi:ATP-dependent protease ClpP protease subunit